jgi:ABC-type phosphate transport system substrate-binding protein
MTMNRCTATQRSWNRLAPALVAAVCLVTVAPAFAWAEVVVVVNESVVDQQVARKELQRIYLGKRSTWDDKSTVVPVILKEGPVHEEFVEDVVGRSVHRFANYWRQMVFTGKGTPPTGFASEAEVVEFVKITPGAVGYVSPQAEVTGVKVLTID